MARYFWLKLPEDFFDEDTIDFIESQENGERYVLFYLKLCLKALKSEGKLIRCVGEMFIPYDEISISKLTRTDIDTVRAALVLFSKIGLIKRLETGEIYLSQMNELVGSETDSAQRKRQQRIRENLTNNSLSQNTRDEDVTMSQKSVTMSQNFGKMSQKSVTMSQECHIEKDIDIELEKEKEQELDAEKPRACNFDTHNDVTDVQKVSTPSVTESVQMLQSCTPESETSCTFQDVVKQCFEKIQVHNQNHSVQKRVPISRDFMTFVQKEGRLLAEYLKAENPEAILKALTNYLKVADMDSWKTAFSFQAFCKNYIEYTDDYFAVEKFDKTSDPEEICQQFRNRMEQDNRFDVAEFLQHKKDWLALGRPDGEDYFIQQEKWYATDED